MCGIFAYTGDGPPNPALLADAARYAARRGPHAHGWAGPETPPHRALGPINPEDCLKITGRAVLGHARLATVGAPTDLSGIQPIEVEGHLLAYNGTVTNPLSLTRESVATDTIAVAHAYARHRAAGLAPDSALTEVLHIAQARAWALAVLDQTGVVLTHRQRLPLFRHTCPENGVYLSSGRFNPRAIPIPENTVILE